MTLFIGTRISSAGQGGAESFRQTGHLIHVATVGTGVTFKLLYDVKIRYYSANLPQVTTMSSSTPAFVWDTDAATSITKAVRTFDPAASKYVVFCLAAGGQAFLAREIDIPTIAAIAGLDIVATDLLHHWDGWHQYQQTVAPPSPDNPILVLEGSLVSDDNNTQLIPSFADSFSSLGHIRGSGAGLHYAWPVPSDPSLLGKYAANYGLVALSQNRIASDIAGHCMVIDASGRLQYGPADHTPDTYTDITDTTYNSSSTALGGSFPNNTCCGVNCDGTTWWALICQVSLSGALSTPIDWRMDVYSSTDGTTWTHQRLVQHAWPNTRSALGIGPAGQILVIDNLPHIPDVPFFGVTNPTDPLVYSIGKGSSALIALNTSSSSFLHKLSYNLFTVMADPYMQHTYYYRPSSIASLYAPVRFCDGANGPIWFGGPNVPSDLTPLRVPYGIDPEYQKQTVVDMAGAFDDKTLCIAMDDSAGGLYGIDDTNGDFIQRPGVAGTAWNVLIAAVGSANDECPLLQFSRKQAGKIVLIHGSGGVAKTTYIDPVALTVSHTTTYGIPLVDTAYGTGNTSNSQIYTTFTALAEPSP